MAAAAASVPVRELDDVTECPICAEVLTDARVLPCIHTFCLKCLQTYAGNANPGDKKVCPLCRQHFAVPGGGLEKLPRNYFVEKVLEVKSMATRLSLSSDVTCDVCNEDSSATKTHKTAAVFCTDCNHNMCSECNKYHQKFKANSSHKLIELNKRHSAVELLQKLPADHCHVHIQKTLELYCFQCEVAICMMCYVESHNSHKCGNVKTAACELNSHMQTDIDNLGKKDVQWVKILAKITADQESFEVSARKCERDINQRADYLKNVVDYYRVQLLNEVAAAKSNQTHETKVIKDEIERQSVVLKNFIKYMSELKKKGTACDIAKLASSLHTRASELCKLEVEKDLASTTDVNFISTTNDEEIKTDFGQLDIKVSKGGDFLASAKLLRTLAVSFHPVLGVSSIDNQIFVLCGNTGFTYIHRYNTPSLQICVYNASTFNIEGRIQISNELHKRIQRRVHRHRKSQQNTHAFTACSHNNCLYISDKNNCFVHNVPVRNVMFSDLVVTWEDLAEKPLSRWSVECPPSGLSTNSAHNVLVACAEKPMFLEYTTDGSLVRRVTLQPHVQYSAEQVVQLSSGRCGIIGLHKGAPGYCIVDDNGRVLKMVQIPVSGFINTADLSTPCSLAVLHPRKVLITDQINNRILVLTETENSLAREWLANEVCGELKQPCCVHYDASRGRLYIGEYDTGRVLCCGI